MHNLHPPPKIPAGMFDIANGYYDPDSGKVYTYSVRPSPVTSAHTHHLAFPSGPSFRHALWRFACRAPSCGPQMKRSGRSS